MSSSSDGSRSPREQPRSPRSPRPDGLLTQSDGLQQRVSPRGLDIRACKLIFSPANRVTVLDAAGGHSCGLSLLVDPRSPDKTAYVMLFTKPDDVEWLAPLAQVTFSLSTDKEDLAVFRDLRPGHARSIAVVFASLADRAKTAAALPKTCLSDAAGSGDRSPVFGSEVDDESSSAAPAAWAPKGEMEQLADIAGELKAGLAQLSAAYKTSFAIDLTTETVSSLWLEAEATLTKKGVTDPGVLSAVRDRMVQYGASINVQRGRPGVTVAAASAALDQQLQRLTEVVEHVRFVLSQQPQGQPEAAKRQQPKEDSEDELEEQRLQAEVARAKGHTLASSMSKLQVVRPAAESVKKEGWLELRVRGGFKKHFIKTSGPYLYAFKAQGVGFPALSIALRGSRISPYTAGAKSSLKGVASMFKITHPGEEKIVFRCESPEAYNEWMYILAVLTGQ